MGTPGNSAQCAPLEFQISPIILSVLVADLDHECYFEMCDLLFKLGLTAEESIQFITMQSEGGFYSDV